MEHLQMNGYTASHILRAQLLHKRFGGRPELFFANLQPHMFVRVNDCHTSSGNNGPRFGNFVAKSRPYYIESISEWQVHGYLCYSNNDSPWGELNEIRKESQFVLTNEYDGIYNQNLGANQLVTTGYDTDSNVRQRKYHYMSIHTTELRITDIIDVCRGRLTDDSREYLSVLREKSASYRKNIRAETWVFRGACPTSQVQRSKMDGQFPEGCVTPPPALPLLLPQVSANDRKQVVSLNVTADLPNLSTNQRKRGGNRAVDAFLPPPAPDCSFIDGFTSEQDRQVLIEYYRNIVAFLEGLGTAGNERNGSRDVQNITTHAPSSTDTPTAMLGRYPVGPSTEPRPNNSRKRRRTIPSNVASLSMSDVRRADSKSTQHAHRSNNKHYSSMHGTASPWTSDSDLRAYSPRAPLPTSEDNPNNFHGSYQDTNNHIQRPQRLLPLSTLRWTDNEHTGLTEKFEEIIGREPDKPLDSNHPSQNEQNERKPTP